MLDRYTTGPCCLNEESWKPKRQLMPDVFEKRQLKALVDVIDNHKIMMATILGFFLATD